MLCDKILLGIIVHEKERRNFFNKKYSNVY